MNRRITAASAFAVASTEAVAHATGMEGLAVVVIGMVVGVPAALILLVSIVILLAKKEGSSFASVMRFVAPVLGVAFPLVMVMMGAKSDLIEASFLFDLPAIALAIVATIIAIKKSA